MYIRQRTCYSERPDSRLTDVERERRSYYVGE